VRPTVGKVANSATTATTASTPNTIVLRDGTGAIPNVYTKAEVDAMIAAIYVQISYGALVVGNPLHVVYLMEASKLTLSGTNVTAITSIVGSNPTNLSTAPYPVWDSVNKGINMTSGANIRFPVMSNFNSDHTWVFAFKFTGSFVNYPFFSNYDLASAGRYFEFICLGSGGKDLLIRINSPVQSIQFTTAAWTINTLYVICIKWNGATKTPSVRMNGVDLVQGATLGLPYTAWATSAPDIHDGVGFIGEPAARWYGCGLYGTQLSNSDIDGITNYYIQNVV